MMGRRAAAVTALVIILVAGCSSSVTESDGDSSGGASTSLDNTSTGGATDASSTTTEAEDTYSDGDTTTTARETTTTVEEEPSSTTAGDDDTDETDSSESEPGGGVLRPVEPGQSSDDVLALQERLYQAGFAPGTADGEYGNRTTRAVEAFQTVAGLEVTGVADADTIAALVEFRYDGLVLHQGDEGPEVEELQQRLAAGPFDPGPVDGQYGTATTQAVWALEKLAGVPVDGDWGPLDERAWEQLQNGEIAAPARSHDQRWVEVDLSEQLMKVYDPGATAPTLVSHVSTGSGVPWSNEGHSGSSITPLGDFAISRRIAGWRESSLDIGSLYNPLYFNGGIALHGALSVPLQPASHGCVRVPMHVAEYLPGELPNGTPVHVLA